MRFILNYFVVLLSLLCHRQLVLVVNCSQKLNCQLMDDTAARTELRQLGEPSAPCRLSPAGFSILVTRPSRQLIPYFHIREPESTLETARLVDLDRLCSDTGHCCDRHPPNCTLSLALINGAATRHIDVVVLDRNDHAPEFPSRSVFQIDLSERREPDDSSTKIDLPVARDADRERFGVLRYELQPSDPVFQLDQGPLDDVSEPIPVLRQRGRLDRETRSSYEFVLKAIDRGSPALTGSTSIRIRITDVNDNRPVFDQAAYSAEVAESASPGQRVLCVNATDADEGEFGRVRYSIKTPPGGRAVSEFSIGSASGCISVARRLDFETEYKFAFTVVAADSDRSPNSAETEVKINILDVNDCYPEVTVHSSVDAGVLEGNRTGELLVAVVTVLDSDSGAGGDVTCEVVPSSKYRIEPSTSSAVDMYNLFLTASLDREIAPVERLKVCCTDRGEPPLRSCRDHSFKVNDINDEAPKFERRLYSATVIENISQAQLPGDVVKVTAADRDEEPRHNLLTYSMPAGFGDYFYIDNRTGMIRTWRPIDRETRAGFVIPVTAEDPGGLRDTATVSISVIDVNDNAPVLHYPDGQELSVLENCSLGTPVGRVEAADPDSGDFGQVRFALLPDAQPSAWHDFRVDPSSGRVFTNRRLDRERQQAYQLRVLVTDNPSGGRRQQNSATATLTVRVLDVNDNSPEIQFPTLDNKTFGVSWRERAFQPVLQVRATDRDAEENALLRYELEAAPRDKDLFYIDPGDGKIRINRQMSESDLGDHQLTVRVSDSALLEPPRSSRVRLTIRVDRSAPKFLPSGPAQPPRGGGGGGGGSEADGAMKIPGEGRRGGGRSDGNRFSDDDPEGRRRGSDSGTVLVAAVAVACALTLLLLAAALCLCHRRGLFAELLGASPTSLAQQRQRQRQRLGRKASGAPAGSAGVGGCGGGGGQLEALAFLGAGSGRGDEAREKSFPSVTSSLNQSAATAATFDESANYVTYGGPRMPRRGPTHRADACSRNSGALTSSKQPQLLSASAAEELAYQEALTGCSDGPSPAYYDLDPTTNRSGQRQQQSARHVTKRIPGGGRGPELLQLMARSGSASNLMLQQAQQLQQPQTLLPLALPAAGAPCTDHLSRKLFGGESSAASSKNRAASFDLFDQQQPATSGDQTLKHQGKLYSIPKASYV